MMKLKQCAGMALRLAAVGAVALLAGCTRVSPVRTLPSWVRGVYIPTVKNKSFEPGLEIPATRAIQEAFIEDGRVDIVPQKDADLVVIATIENFKGKSAKTTGDHVSTNESINMTVDVRLFEPLDLEKPIAVLPKVLVNNSFYEDVRSVDFVPEPDRIQNLMNALGSQVVSQVINGFPAQLANAPEGALVPPVQSPNQVSPETPLQTRPGADTH